MCTQPLYNLVCLLNTRCKVDTQSWVVYAVKSVLYRVSSGTSFRSCWALSVFMALSIIGTYIELPLSHGNNVLQGNSRQCSFSSALSLYNFVCLWSKTQLVLYMLLYKSTSLCISTGYHRTNHQLICPAACLYINNNIFPFFNIYNTQTLSGYASLLLSLFLILLPVTTTCSRVVVVVVVVLCSAGVVVVVVVVSDKCRLCAV